MTTNAVEMALWTLANDASAAQAFVSAPDEFLQRYQLSEREGKDIKALNVRALAEQGASTLLLMQAWNSVRGPNQIAEYLERMNSPRR